MPGGRLTRQDRQRIASGLAEGRGYAEIARQLERPTSTVSREVARNGGPEGYRADKAHRATRHRARRPGSTRPPVAAGPEAVRDFVEHFATLMAQTGLSRMASRVLTCLFTTDSGALTAAELVRHLRVSPASISKAIGYLEELELVRRERDPRNRRERYLVDDDVWLRAWMASSRKNATWSESAQQGAEILGPTTPAGARLEQMGQFFARVGEDMSSGIDIPAAAEDALTVLAALAHAAGPLTIDQLATALAWPEDRVATALQVAEQHPAITDPVAPHRPTATTYTVAARPTRLTPTQRRALTELQSGGVGIPGVR